MIPIAPWVNKEVPLRYRGANLNFSLSHGLFSSFDIDAGSKLLLKTIAQQITLDKPMEVLDGGCGTGVLGIAVGSGVPECKIDFQDRDYLSLLFSRYNAAANGVAPRHFSHGLLLQDLGEKKYDLLVSNLPAKAGAPVLKDFINRAPGFLKEKGNVCIVVVKTLSDFIRQTIHEQGHLISYEEIRKEHSVFHFSPSNRAEGEGIPAGQPGAPLLKPYIRGKKTFLLSGRSYTLKTVFNLPDFDTPGYQVEIAVKLLSGSKELLTSFAKPSLFWNPGQGHIPSWLGTRLKNAVFGGRDFLELSISALNLKQNGGNLLTSAPALTPGEIDRIFSFIHLNHRTTPGLKMEGKLLDEISSILEPGGYLLVTGKSGEVHHFEHPKRGLILHNSRKYRGFRGLLLKKSEIHP